MSIAAVHRAGVGAVVFAVLTAGTVAGAQTPCVQQVSADALEEQGRALRENQRDREALALFQRAYGLCRGARALLRIGLAEGAVGQWVEASQHVGEALARQDDPWITANRASAEAQFATINRHVGRLELQGTPAAGAVWIGSQRVGTWPMTRPLTVLAGTVVFSVRVPGFVTVTRTVEVSPGGLARERIELVPVPASVEGGALATTVAPLVVSPTVEPVQSAVVQPPTGEVQPTVGAQSSEGPSGASGSGRTWAWTTAVGAVVFLAGGGVAYALGASAAATWNDDTMCLTAASSVTRGAQCGGQQSTANTMQALSVTGLVGGGLLAVTSAVLFLVSGSPRPDAQPAPRAAVGCGTGPGAIGISCAGTF